MDQTGQYVRLVTVGRRTRKPHSVIVRYVMFEGAMVVFPQRGLRQDWVANLRVNPKVAIYTGDTRWDGDATEARASGSKDPVLGAFARKYGESEVKRRYWGQLDYFRIELGPRAKEDYFDLVYSDLETAFDGVADTYDRHIMGNPMNLWLRNRSLALMTKLFKPGETIIEVGCGTGTETLALAKQGIRVIATDISSRMLQVLTQKARSEDLEEMVLPIHCRPYEIQKAVMKRGYAVVDGAYSTYGAVNTEPRLLDMLTNLHDTMKQNGVLVLGIWNKFCLYEIVGYALRGRPTMSVARLRNPVPVGKSRFCVTTNSFSPESLDRVVRGLFTRLSLHGVEILLPPSNLVNYLPPPTLLSPLKRIDVLLESSFPWNRLGDHFLAVYRRNE